MSKSLRRTRRWFFALRNIWVLISCWYMRTRTNVRQHIPKQGPVLILANHVSLFDPPQVGSFVGRNVHFMAGEQLFEVPIVGFLVERVGAFPKKQFVKDRDSMIHLNELYEAGEVVALFPEGSRSWDGRLQRILPGIARLIKRIDARVVFVRVKTGHLQHPRWAKTMRWIPSRMEADAPVSFPPEMTQEEILELIRERLIIDWRAPAPRGSFGYRMAEGLPDYLWACPHCFAAGGLRVHAKDRNRVVCGECGHAWRVDVHARLNPVEGGEPQHIADAHDAIIAHFGDPPVVDHQRLRETGEILFADPARIHQLKGGPKSESRVLAEGRLVLTDHDLRVDGTEWRLALTELQTVNQVLGGQLQFRTGGKLHRLELGEGTPAPMWVHFIKQRMR